MGLLGVPYYQKYIADVLNDIRDHFKGHDDKGNMNHKSADETYNKLIGNLRSTLKTLAKKIEPKVYAYGFLKSYIGHC